MFEKWNPKEHERRMRFIARIMRPETQSRKKIRVLDLGAYEGALKAFLSRNTEYYPIDIFDHRDIFPNWIVQDINKNTKLPYRDDFFDEIAFIGTIEHLFFPEDVLSEVKRVLKKDGFAIISFPNDNNWYWKLMAHTFHNLDSTFDELKYFHHWFYGEKSSRTLVEKFFKIKDKKYYNGLYGRFIPFAKSEIIYKVRK